MIRRVCLYQHAPGAFATPGATGDLGQQLKGALGRSEIGHIQGEVRHHYANERYAREVETLRDHLGSDQDIDFAARQIREDRCARAAPAAGVAIHPLDARGGHQFRDRLHQPLRSESLPGQAEAVTFGTLVRRRRALAAVMASQ